MPRGRRGDRLSRCVKELLVFLEDELASHGINLHILLGVCAGVHRLGGQSIADKLLFLVAAMAAEMERDLIRERALDGLAAAGALTVKQTLRRRGGFSDHKRALPPPGRRARSAGDHSRKRRWSPRGQCATPDDPDHS
ncbi:recombinase family protein [Planomonospora sp. ID91781]|uniref:recombinase family protein n=1 Tax=Planomonospora sp. ID91781 TaxID=2738135 RepID=UPI00210607BC|nr:recombinase family protein [Planomonospora sp. ID91781]